MVAMSTVAVAEPPAFVTVSVTTRFAPAGKGTPLVTMPTP